MSANRAGQMRRVISVNFGCAMCRACTMSGEHCGERHPDVIWQSCASGGGRADLGILHFADQVWTSDNTEATSRLNIQEGYSQYFPPTRWKPGSPMRIRKTCRWNSVFMSACAGRWAWAVISRMESGRTRMRGAVHPLYKEIRQIVQFGDQYPFDLSAKDPFSAVQYVSKDKTEGVLFAFRAHIPDFAA